MAKALRVKVPVGAFHINNSFTLNIQAQMIAEGPRQPLLASILQLAVWAVGSNFEGNLLNWVIIMQPEKNQSYCLLCTLLANRRLNGWMEWKYVYPLLTQVEEETWLREQHSL